MTAATLRRGLGLEGPQCEDRVKFDQDNPPGVVAQKMCVCCGRVTARVGVDGLFWCGGSRRATAADNRPRYRDRGVSL